MTEKNRLQKAIEKTKQMEEKQRRKKWKKFRGINEREELELWNIVIILNLLIFRTKKNGN